MRPISSDPPALSAPAVPKKLNEMYIQYPALKMLPNLKNIISFEDVTAELQQKELDLLEHLSQQQWWSNATKQGFWLQINALACVKCTYYERISDEGYYSSSYCYFNANSYDSVEHNSEHLELIMCLGQGQNSILQHIPIDTQIATLVVLLNVLGFKTTESCEHTNSGDIPAFTIWFKAEENPVIRKTGLLKIITQLFKEHKALLREYEFDIGIERICSSSEEQENSEPTNIYQPTLDNLVKGNVDILSDANYIYSVTLPCVLIPKFEELLSNLLLKEASLKTMGSSDTNNAFITSRLWAERASESEDQPLAKIRRYY